MKKCLEMPEIRPVLDEFGNFRHSAYYDVIMEKSIIVKIKTKKEIRTYQMLLTDGRPSVGKYLFSENILRCSKNAYAVLVYSNLKLGEGHFWCPKCPMVAGGRSKLFLGLIEGCLMCLKKHYQTAGLGWNHSVRTFFQFFPVI